MRLAAMFLALAGLLGAETFTVIHARTAWPDEEGSVEINDEGIRFTAREAGNSRQWRWLDIQYFDRISETEFNVLTYEDQTRFLGRDKSYRFRILEGKLSDDLLASISRELARPVTNRVVRDTDNVLWEVPVKHLHTFGGCQGVLRFTPDKIYYSTDHETDSREWLLGRDVDSVWSADRYRLSIQAYDNNRREFSRTRSYRFELKAPLDEAFYRSLKLRLYDLESAHLPLASGAVAGVPGLTSTMAETRTGGSPWTQ